METVAAPLNLKTGEKMTITEQLERAEAEFDALVSKYRPLRGKGVGAKKQLDVERADERIAEARKRVRGLQRKAASKPHTQFCENCEREANCFKFHALSVRTVCNHSSEIDCEDAEEIQKVNAVNL